MPPLSSPAAHHTDWVPSLEDRSRPVYLAIADAIAADIGAGRLRPGDRLPPQRILADRLGIDFTTVSRAYGEARHRGLVDARVGQGTFVRKGGPAVQPAPAEPQAAAAPPLAVSMAMNQPPQPEESAALTARMSRGIAAATAGLGLPDLLRYPDGADSPDDREAAVHWLRHRLPGLASDHVLVAPGTQAALLALLSALTRPGDTVCAEALTYPGFRAAAAQLGLRVVGVPMDADGIDPDALRAVLGEHRPKALYCIPTFHNPTTATLPEERRRAVAAAVREHNVPIIEDDIYGPLPERAPPPLAAFAPDLTYHVAGLAKCVSPALRIAYVAAPDARQARRVAAAQRATTLIASPLSAAVARLWIADGTAEAVRDAIRAEAMARRALAESLLPADRVVTKREAFHLWLTLPDGWTGGDFTAHLRSRGISAVAADAFATTPEVPAALRFCLGAPLDRAETRRALEVLADALVLPPAAGVII
ncbi:aminotransferase-like domain-containing protein [Azospirillum isscasi]|uniref:PLP-dependent aminotransferase family protein n=1 Tax=Azospirillum isscasi TaxID=3053926 RepID=A0ABU0WIY8_9PROT|nr:PLP-dependent aminotransferase family protein [Azospirillum isscasi]MDQ2104057.1 PLP-dependent aminotransferase family protein [Azospirillum isscasi]